MTTLENITPRHLAVELDHIPPAPYEGTALLTKVEEAEKELWWEMYDEEFAESNRKSPCRQSFYKEEFMDAIDSPDMTKAVYIKDGEITAVCLLSNNLDHFPWLSKDYFEANYPEDYSNGEILYFISLLTKKEHRRQDHASETLAMLTELLKLEQSRPTVIFDCTENNAAFLPGMIEAVVEETGNAEIHFEETGRQIYFAGKLALTETQEEDS